MMSTRSGFTFDFRFPILDLRSTFSSSVSPIIDSPERNANQKSQVKDPKSQFQQSWRWIDANQFLLYLDADTDLLRHRNQELTSRVIFAHQDFDSDRSTHRAHAANELSVNRLAATTLQFPFVKLILS